MPKAKPPATKRRIPANMTLDAELKAAAKQYSDDKGIPVSEIAERLLARKLVDAGYLRETDEGYVASTGGKRK